EKAMGAREAMLALWIGRRLDEFVDERDLGVVLGADGAQRLAPGCVRIPDVLFLSRARLPGGVLPDSPLPDLVPDLAVEVLSKSNTKREMERKRIDYFTAGARLVWQLDPKKRTVAVYTAPEVFTTLTEADDLTGGDVLPGFTLSLKSFFARMDRETSKETP
ncbi:MAG: Uma2 family endonuclease, partial [Planctomycetia bacterium]